MKKTGAVQPFISGAISKTVNLPEAATVDEVSELLLDAPGSSVLKALHCETRKIAQPLSGQKEAGVTQPAGAATSVPPAPEDRCQVGPQVPRGRLRGLHPRRPLRRCAGRHPSTSPRTERRCRPTNPLWIAVSMGWQYASRRRSMSKMTHMRFERAR